MNNPLQIRNQSLDALRGFAILAMVLSGSIAFGGLLPAWMYHAQVPPPKHVFDPAIPGITWVDLVFPFFLFSMGAAIPLSLRKWELQTNSNVKVWWTAFRRYLLLTWFGIFIYHMRAWVIEPSPGAREQLLSLSAFLLLFFQLYSHPAAKKGALVLVLRIVSYAISIVLLFILPFHDGKGFLLDKSDIIIIVLANMAFFGSLLWWYTRDQPWRRVAVLPFVMAIFLGSKEAGSLNEIIFNWSPIPWMYKFYYLKYLFIIVPGTFAGEWMLRFKDSANTNTTTANWTTLLSVSIIISNTLLLFTRDMLANIAITIGLLVIVHLLNKKEAVPFVKRCLNAGTYLLLLGLCFEAFEGGIKKDSSTYSYYFVTSGLAFLAIIVFHSWQYTTVGKKIIQFLAANGRNPMVAYVAGNLVVTPLLYLTGLITTFNLLNYNAWTGFLKGIIFTAIVSIITLGFTRKKWFWKT